MPVMISLAHAKDINGLSESAGMKGFVIIRWHDKPFYFPTWQSL